VNKLVVDPGNAQVVYAALAQSFPGIVYRSTDDGQHWTNLSGNLPGLPVEALLFDSTNQVLYAGNTDGVYASTDGGASWSRFGASLPHVEVKDLKFDLHLGILAAATYGRGIWELQMIASPAEVTGRVFDDTTSKGVAGQVVFLDLNGDGLLDGNEPGTITAGDGLYRFHNLPAGSYTVALVSKTGWSQISADPQVMLATGQQATGVNIGVRNTGVLQFSAAGYRVKEGQVGTITVTRSLGSEGRVTVAYATSPGRALAGVNYVTTSGVLTFVPGQKSQTFFVRTRDDQLNNDDLTANLVLTSPGGGASLGNARTVVLTIANIDPPPRVTFRTYLEQDSESIASPAIQVVLSAPSAKTVTVNYGLDTPAGSATGGVDYTLNPGTLTFAPGIVSQLIPLEVTPDKQAKGKKTIRLRLSSAINASLGAYTHFTYVILEDGR
jgi:chitinase